MPTAHLYPKNHEMGMARMGAPNTLEIYLLVIFPLFFFIDRLARHYSIDLVTCYLFDGAIS